MAQYRTHKRADGTTRISIRIGPHGLRSQTRFIDCKNKAEVVEALELLEEWAVEVRRSGYRANHRVPKLTGGSRR